MPKEEISVDDLIDIEAGSGLDLETFEGQKVKIAKLDIIEVKSQYDEDGNKLEGDIRRPVKVIKISTVPVTKITTKEGEEKDIGGSELFNLRYDKEQQKWGISTSEKAKIRIFMARMKVNNVKALVGKSVTLKANTDPESGRTYLGFIVK